MNPLVWCTDEDTITSAKTCQQGITELSHGEIEGKPRLKAIQKYQGQVQHRAEEMVQLAWQEDVFRVPIPHK